MGVQESLRYAGLKAKMSIGLASPEEKGQFVAVSLMLVLNHLHATVRWTQVAEGAKDMARTPDMLRDFNRDAYRRRVEKIVEQYDMDREEALGMSPDVFFGVAGSVMLERGIIHIITTSMTPEDQRQRSLTAIKEEFGKRVEDQSVAPGIRDVLRSFRTTGFDQAVTIGEMQRALRQN